MRSLVNFKQAEQLAKQFGLILEREGRGYSLTDNEHGTEWVCRTLTEVAEAIAEAIGYRKL